MTNQLTSLMPRIVARGLLNLRHKAILPQLVNSDFNAAAARRGAIIDVPLSQPIEAEEVVPAATPPAPPSQSLSSVPITLNQWRKAAFYLTDQEMDQIEAHDSFIPLQMGEAISALARAVNDHILTLMHETESFIGTVGRAPFSPEPTGDDEPGAETGMRPIIEARHRLNQAAAPKSGRSVILDYDAEAAFLSHPHAQEAAFSGTQTPQSLEGEIGRRFGFDCYATDSVHTDEAPVNPVSPSSTYGKGNVNLFLKHPFATLPPGPVYIPPFNEPCRMLNRSIASSNRSQLHLTPGLPRTVTSGDTVFLTRPPTAGFAFHRDAVALAMRPLTQTGLIAGQTGQIMSITDPDSGLSLRLEVSRQYKQTVWEFDLLWGAALVRPELVVKIAGAGGL